MKDHQNSSVNKSAKSAKSADLSLTPGIHKVEEENKLQKVVL